MIQILEVDGSADQIKELLFYIAVNGIECKIKNPPVNRWVSKGDASPITGDVYQFNCGKFFKVSSAYEPRFTDIDVMANNDIFKFKKK